MLTRVLIGLSILAMLGWLLISPAPEVRRAEAINAALSRGELGLLNPDERARYQVILQEWATLAGVTLPVFLDAPLSDRVLNVYSTGTAAAALTRNTRGNATYDPQINAIFIDIDYFRPSLVSMMDIGIGVAPQDAPTPSAYLIFSFLHELGHYVKHRHALRDPTDESLEIEADRFAIDVMARKEIGRVRDKGLQYFNNLRYFIPPDVTKEKHIIDISGAPLQTIDALLLTDTPYTPYSFDDEHPSFVSRALRIVSQARMAAKEVQVKMFSSLIEEEFLRFQLNLCWPIVQLSSPFAVGTVGLSGQDVLIVSEDASRIIRSAWPRDLLKRSDPQGQLQIVKIDDRASAPIASATVEDVNVSSYSPIWSFEPLKNNEWQAFQDAGSLEFSPATDIRAVPTNAKEEPWVWEISKQSEPIGQLTATALLEALSRQEVPSSALIEPVTVIGETAYFLVSSEGNQPQGLGLVILDMNRLNSPKYVKMNFPRDDEMSYRGEGLARRIVILQDEQQLHVYAVLTTFTLDNYFKRSVPYQIQVWRISVDAAPLLLTTHSAVKEAIKSTLAESGIESRVFQVAYAVPMGKKTFLININGDSIYHFDDTSKSLRLLFHPGGLKMAISGGGRLALNAPGSNKIFLLDTSAGPSRSCEQQSD